MPRPGRPVALKWRRDKLLPDAPGLPAAAIHDRRHLLSANIRAVRARLTSAQPGDLALQPEDGLLQRLKIIYRQDHRHGTTVARDRVMLVSRRDIVHDRRKLVLSLSQQDRNHSQRIGQNSSLPPGSSQATSGHLRLSACVPVTWRTRNANGS